MAKLHSSAAVLHASPVFVDSLRKAGVHFAIDCKQADVWLCEPSFFGEGGIFLKRDVSQSVVSFSCVAVVSRDLYLNSCPADLDAVLVEKVISEKGIYSFDNFLNE